MVKGAVLTVCALLTFSTASVISPYDLADEALEQLEQLKSLIQGNILVAHNDFDNLGNDFQTYTTNMHENSKIDMQQEHETIVSQLNTVKDLAESAGYNITSCTWIREDVLINLAETIFDKIGRCIAPIDLERSTILQDATYIVDIEFNKVYNLENQLQSCRGDLLCISPLLTQIELYNIQLPQNIQTQVQSVEELLDTLRLSIQNCGDTNVSFYIEDANSRLKNIIECIERVMEE